jgi:small conductance mechanosensitive channel
VLNRVLAQVVPAAASPAPPEEQIAESATSLWESTPDALPRGAVALAVAGWLVGRLVRRVVARVFSRRRTPSFARVISTLAGWLFVLAVVLAAVAITFPSVRPVDILAGLGFFSLAAGFAFQDILENLLSGVLLLFRQPFRSGDQIQVSDQVGTVREINIRETQLVTFDGELVVTPNRDVYENVIVVNTFQSHRRLELRVGIGYDADVDQAAGLILESVARVDGVSADPSPQVLVHELSTSTVDLRVLVRTSSRQADVLTVRDVAIRQVKRALDAAKISLPPQVIQIQAGPALRNAMGELPDGRAVGPVTPGPT